MKTYICIMFFISFCSCKKRKRLVEDLGDQDRPEVKIKLRNIDLKDLETKDTDPTVLIKDLMKNYFETKSP